MNVGNDGSPVPAVYLCYLSVEVNAVKSLSILTLLLVLPGAALAAEATASGAVVSYEKGIDVAQAQALAEVLSAARQIYVEEFGFDMPKTVRLKVRCGRDEPTRLYTDGQDHLFLSIPSKGKLAKPSNSGVFNLYGLCHELGHIAMYRTLKDRDWMTSAAAEGWAHYAGSVVVDAVFAVKGESLWPDAYDYRVDGTARLTKQLAAKRVSKTAKGAGQWLELESIIGRAGFVELFSAWQAADIDVAKPEAALLVAAMKMRPAKKADLEKWWESGAPLFVEKRSSSKFKAVRISASRLSGEPITLAFDDDASEGKKSIAGGGHARKFSPPGLGEWYIRAVSVYGARYGHPRPPKGTFDVALCDDQLRRIAAWKKPYGTFERGNLKWVRMEVPPTRVPKTFNVCLNFRPTATKGVFVAYDTSTKGNSVVGTPGKPGSPFGQGDWMIRVELDQPKEADPLKAE